MATPFANAVGLPPAVTSSQFKSWFLNYINWRLGEAPLTQASNLYVSTSQGSDANNGLTPTTAVATLAKAQILINGNQTVWLLDGDEWSETMTISYPTSASYSSSTTTQTCTLVGFLSTVDNWTNLTPGNQWAYTTANTTNGGAAITAPQTTNGYTFPTSGTFLLNSATTVWNVVSYTNYTGGQFTGCTGSPASTFPVAITPNWAPQPIIGQYVGMTGGTTEYGIITAYNNTTGVMTITNPTGANFNGTSHTALTIVTPRQLVGTAAGMTFRGDWQIAGTQQGQRKAMITTWGFRNNSDAGASSAYNGNNFTSPNVGAATGPVVVTAGTSTTIFTTPYLLQAGQVISVASAAANTPGTKATVSTVTGPSGGNYTVTIAPALANTPTAADTFNSPYLWTWVLQGANVDKHQVAWIRERDDITPQHQYRQMGNPWQVEQVEGSWFQDPNTSILYVHPLYNRGKNGLNLQPVYPNCSSGIVLQAFDNMRVHSMNVSGHGMSQNTLGWQSNTAVTVAGTEKAYGIKSNATGAQTHVVDECEVTFNYSHNIGHTTGSSGGYFVCINNTWGYGICNGDTVGYAATGGLETVIYGGKFLGDDVLQGIQPSQYVGNGPPAFSHTGYQSAALGTAAISSYVPSGQTATFTATPPASGNKAVGNYIQLTGGSGSEFCIITGITGTGPYNYNVQSVNGNNMMATHTTMGAGTWQQTISLFIIANVQNTPSIYQSIEYGTPTEAPSYVFPIYQGGANLATTGAYLTQDPANNVYLPSPAFAVGEQVWARGGTEELLTIASYNSLTGLVTTTATNGTTHTALVSLSRCRAFIYNCTQYAVRQNRWIQNNWYQAITATAGSDTTIALLPAGASIAVSSQGSPTNQQFNTATQLYPGQQLTVLTTTNNAVGQIALVSTVSGTGPYTVTLQAPFASSGAILTSDTFTLAIPASQAPQNGQWIRLDGGASLQPEWVQCKSYNTTTGVVTLADGTAPLQTTTVQNAGRVVASWDMSLTLGGTGINRTGAYLGNPNGIVMGGYYEFAVQLITSISGANFFTSPANMWNGSTTDSSTTLYNAGGTTLINCILYGVGGETNMKYSGQGVMGWLADATHRAGFRMYNCRIHSEVPPRTIACIDIAAGAGSSLNANQIGMYNCILSADYQGLSNMSSLSTGAEGGLSVGTNNSAQYLRNNVYANCNLNATLAVGTAGYSNDPYALTIPGTPPLFFQPTAGSAYLTGTVQLVEGNTLQVDYYGNTRNASSPAIGPLEPMANNTGIVPPMRF